MTSKEALKKICIECEREMGKNRVACPFRSISNEYCNEYDKVANDLEALDILKRKLVIEIGRDLVNLKEDKEQECDYTCIIVNQQERELLKEMLENDR